MGLGILYLRGEEPEDVEWGWSSLRRGDRFSLMLCGARRWIIPRIFAEMFLHFGKGVIYSFSVVPHKPFFKL